MEGILSPYPTAEALERSNERVDGNAGNFAGGVLIVTVFEPERGGEGRSSTPHPGLPL